ncbi:STAS domain-containing protein [Rhodococcus ruber]|uniref:STAS domain-containing protein n=1 Tax=Rhodococcus ruber TaxID=1830 RepID=UPI00111D4F7E|nr:STAS domain-containing protein [Rhodococcus ruber]QDC17408.1 STAS domain-containing protein [Rhodococcus ruber]
MTAPLTLTSAPRPDGATVLTVAGEIDMSNTDALARALDATDTLVVVDLTAVDYLDSAGLAVLFSHAHHIELIAGPFLQPVLTISGLAGLIPVHRPVTAESPAPGDPDARDHGDSAHHGRR